MLENRLAAEMKGYPLDGWYTMETQGCSAYASNALVHASINNLDNGWWICNICMRNDHCDTHLSEMSTQAGRP